MARTKWLKIRVSDDEIIDIKKRAGRHDMSTYARGLILEQPIAAPESKHKNHSQCRPRIGASCGMDWQQHQPNRQTPKRWR